MKMFLAAVLSAVAADGALVANPGFEDDGRGVAAASESVAVSLEESDRVASAPASKPGSEAFIDLSRAFKELDGFNEQMSAIKGKIREFEQECKAQQAELSALSDELKGTSEASRRSELEKELADGKAKLQSRTAEQKQQFLKDEAKVYYDHFELVRAATAEYAKQHGIRVVRRSPSIAYAEKKDDEVDVTDRKAVLDRVNRPVIYSEGPSEIPSDITDAIVQRLNGGGGRR